MSERRFATLLALFSKSHDTRGKLIISSNKKLYHLSLYEIDAEVWEGEIIKKNFLEILIRKSKIGHLNGLFGTSSLSASVIDRIYNYLGQVEKRSHYECKMRFFYLEKRYG